MPKHTLHITGACLLQMYDLYSRERIDTKADIWVSSAAHSAWMVFILFSCNTELLGSFASEVMYVGLKLLIRPALYTSFTHVLAHVNESHHTCWFS